MSRFVKVSGDTPVPYSQERYLSLIQNKIEFIKYLSCFLSAAGISAKICEGEADCEISKKALAIASEDVKPVLVVADDTDIGVMLLPLGSMHERYICARRIL